MGPAGKSSVAFGDACTPDCAQTGETRATPIHAMVEITTSRQGSDRRLCDTDFHLIHGVIKIATGIPQRHGGLDAPPAVGGTGNDSVLATFRQLPVIGPQPPCIMGLFVSEFGNTPGCSAVGGDLDFRDLRFTRPGGSLNGYFASFDLSPFAGAEDG